MVKGSLGCDSTHAPYTEESSLTCAFDLGYGHRCVVLLAWLRASGKIWYLLFPPFLCLFLFLYWRTPSNEKTAIWSLTLVCETQNTWCVCTHVRASMLFNFLTSYIYFVVITRCQTGVRVGAKTDFSLVRWVAFLSFSCLNIFTFNYIHAIFEYFFSPYSCGYFICFFSRHRQSHLYISRLSVITYFYYVWKHTNFLYLFPSLLCNFRHRMKFHTIVSLACTWHACGPIRTSPPSSCAAQTRSLLMVCMHMHSSDKSYLTYIVIVHFIVGILLV